MQVLSKTIVGLTASASALLKRLCRSVVRFTNKLSTGVGNGADDLQSLENLTRQNQ